MIIVGVILLLLILLCMPGGTEIIIAIVGIALFLAFWAAVIALVIGAFVLMAA